MFGRASGTKKSLLMSTKIFPSKHHDFWSTNNLNRLIMLLIIFPMCLLCLGSCSASAPSVTVINGTSYELCSIYTRKASSYASRSSNHLKFEGRLKPGERFEISGLKSGYYTVEAERCNDNIHPGYGSKDFEVGDSLSPVVIIGQ